MEKVMMIVMIVFWSCVGVLLQCAEPIIWIKRDMGYREEEYDQMTKRKRTIHRLLHCAMCLTFWVVLISTFDPVTAVISSVGADILHKIVLRL